MLSRRSLFAAVGGLLASAVLPKMAKPERILLPYINPIVAGYIDESYLHCLTTYEAREFLYAKMSRKS